MARAPWQAMAFLSLSSVVACNGTDPELPDASTIVFARVSASESHLFSMQPNGSDVVQLTDGPVVDSDPAISRDGVSSRSSGTTLWRLMTTSLS